MSLYDAVNCRIEEAIRTSSIPVVVQPHRSRARSLQGLYIFSCHVYRRVSLASRRIRTRDDVIERGASEHALVRSVVARPDVRFADDPEKEEEAGGGDGEEEEEDAEVEATRHLPKNLLHFHFSRF